MEGYLLAFTEDGKTFKCASSYSIFKHIAEAGNFEAIFLGKTEVQTNQILSYFELISGLKEEELAELLNNDLKLRMYLVGFNITAADKSKFDTIDNLYNLKYFQGLVFKFLKMHYIEN